MSLKYSQRLANSLTSMPAANTALAKVAIQCSADTFVVNQTLVLRIKFSGKNATFAKPENVKTQKSQISRLGFHM